jgi:hypothetical protein
MDQLIIELSANFTKIISLDELKTHKKLYWGSNGVGDRWAGKKYNYTVIYASKKTRTYSENDSDTIPEQILNDFLKTKKGSGIIGIFVHSKRENIVLRPIDSKIHQKIITKPCVICGTKTNIICDHKNDLYNDSRVLDIKTQMEDDFQPLCNHCNLQKRQICKEEKESGRIYSAKNIERYKKYSFEFPWEKKVFDTNDKDCKKGTFWYDPVEFEDNIYIYIMYKLPVINEIKCLIKMKLLKLSQ